ncbi:MAG TPA: lipoyl(octanoyl) transferase LipB [Gammaproteobacteria bacterium]|jgi:lipoyl(octanoyl) transferase
MTGQSPSTDQGHALIVRRFGIVEYHAAWRAMRALTDGRRSDTPDELWILQHSPVFTLGQAGRSEYVLSPGDIPVLNSDRGGQVTYHGPGQTVFYILHDLKRARIGVRRLVEHMEQAIIDLLSRAGLRAARLAGAPGVYVNGKKICALGLRVRNGCSYHGLALNVDLDLEPFSRIEPCGMRGLEVTSLQQLGVDWTVSDAERFLIPILAAQLGFSPDAIREFAGDFSAQGPPLNPIGQRGARRLEPGTIQ